MVLSGCAYNLTLYPRGGGEKATGTFEVGSQMLTVAMNGQTYRGRAVAGQATGLAVTQGMVGTKPVFATTPVVTTTNQRSAVLEGYEVILSGGGTTGAVAVVTPHGAGSDITI